MRQRCVRETEIKVKSILLRKQLFQAEHKITVIYQLNTDKSILLISLSD